MICCHTPVVCAWCPRLLALDVFNQDRNHGDHMEMRGRGNGTGSPVRGIPKDTYRCDSL